MGLKSFLANIISSSVKNDKNGNYISVKVEGFKNDILEVESYQQPGLFSRPQKDGKVLVIPIGDDRSHSIIVALNNYKLNLSINEGGTLIYSTDESGQNIKSKILLDNDGKIGMNNESGNLKSLLDSLINAILNIVTIGSPASHSLSPTSKVVLEKVKTDFGKLIKDI